MGIASNILIFLVVGFASQMIDGALGMAYGVSSNTFLLSFGVPPALASASVHAAEMFTTAVSGVSHLKLGNVDKSLFKKLLIPGVIGGVIGSYILTTIPGDVIKPIVALYLLAMGIVILRKAFKKPEEKDVHSHIVPLGAVGGFFDAIGGGGWGPIVTTTLVARGKNPRLAIGSVNASEFFVTVAESVTFILTIGQDLAQNWQIIAGLLLGGVVAAPLAAFICKRIPARALMVVIGTLIILLQLRTLYLSLISSGMLQGLLGM